MAAYPVDGSDGPLVVRRVVLWRRLEPGDVRTPGTEVSAESPYLEAKVLEVGVSPETLETLERLQAVKDEVHRVRAGWSTRYEPGGALFALGGGLGVGTLLEYLPASMLPVAGFTRARKSRVESAAAERWAQTPERAERDALGRRLRPRWERFVERQREATGFRADVRVGDVHEADRLVSIRAERLTDPATWRPDAAPNQVRYSWVYVDGRAVEQVAELEETAPDEEE